MLRKMGLTILLLVIYFPAWGLTEARLMNQSTSGQTVVFNIGFHDGIREGDYAVVVKQIRELDGRDLRLVPVAKARNIKLNIDSSVWILFHIYHSELLVKGDKYEVLAESHLLSGRRSPKLGRISVVTQKDQIKNQTHHALNDDRDRLSKLKHKYKSIQPTHEEKTLSENDFDQLDVEYWEKSKGNRYRSSLYKSVSKDEFRRQLRLTTFEKLVTHYLQKINDPDFNYDAFYEKQRRAEMSNEFKANSNYDSEFNKFLRTQSYRTSADAKLFRTILEKGESWSEDYSDEELRNVLNQVSVLQEKDRRLFVMAKPTRYQVALDYGFQVTDAQTKDDPLYRRNSRYAVESEFEFTPFLKHPDLERFTLNGGFRLNYTAFEADTFNADLNEYSMNLGANWYPWYAPYAVDSPLIFLGTYIRSGFAKAEAPTVNERANYTVLSVPGFRAGFKYMLRNHFGIRLILSFETLKIERYEASKLNSFLPERTNLAEGKLGVGMAYAF
jgi:hypothetical protein